MHKATIDAGNRFEESSKAIHGNKYTYDKVKYTGSSNRVTITCRTHGDFSITPRQHLGDKSGCPSCNTYNNTGTTTAFSSYIWLTTNGEYYLIGDYTNALTKTTILHVKCGNTWSITPNKFKLGRRCPRCQQELIASKTKKLEPTYKRELFIAHNGDIVLKDLYINTMTPIKHQHICGHQWKASPNNILGGTSCPKCQKGTDNDLLYVWNIPFTNIYKVGITSERLGLKRLLEVYDLFGLFKPLSVVKFTKVANATKLEAVLLSRYTNKPKWDYKLDGFSEFRQLNEKELNEMLKIIQLYTKEVA